MVIYKSFFSFSWLGKNRLLYQSNSNSLFHVSYGESSKWSELVVGFNAHWFGRSDGDESAVSGLDEVRALL